MLLKRFLASIATPIIAITAMKWGTLSIHSILWITIVAAGTAFLTMKTIPIAIPYMLKARLSGKDLCKKGTPAGDKPVYV